MKYLSNYISFSTKVSDVGKKYFFFFTQAANKCLENVLVGILQKYVSKSLISLQRAKLLQGTSAMNFLCLNCGLLTETVDFFLLPTAKSLELDNYCIV